MVLVMNSCKCMHVRKVEALNSTPLSGIYSLTIGDIRNMSKVRLPTFFFTFCIEVWLLMLLYYGSYGKQYQVKVRLWWHGLSPMIGLCVKFLVLSNIIYDYLVLVLELWYCGLIFTPGLVLCFQGYNLKYGLCPYPTH
jgi:hypothetical protein